jgi:hypothetical protein
MIMGSRSQFIEDAVASVNIKANDGKCPMFSLRVTGAACSLPLLIYPGELDASAWSQSDVMWVGVTILTRGGSFVRSARVGECTWIWGHAGDSTSPVSA